MTGIVTADMVAAKQNGEGLPLYLSECLYRPLFMPQEAYPIGHMLFPLCMARGIKNYFFCNYDICLFFCLKVNFSKFLVDFDIMSPCMDSKG